MLTVSVIIYLYFRCQLHQPAPGKALNADYLIGVFHFPPIHNPQFTIHHSPLSTHLSLLTTHDSNTVQIVLRNKETEFCSVFTPGFLK